MSCTWDTERGFGERSWRYAAVINDMKVEKLFVEGGGVHQNSGPDPFEVCTRTHTHARTHARTHTHTHTHTLQQNSGPDPFELFSLLAILVQQ